MAKFADIRRFHIPNPKNDTEVRRAFQDLFLIVEKTETLLNNSITVTDTETINLTLNTTTHALSADAIVQMSITSDASGLKLSGDATTPGNQKYYGTDGAGTKGFYAIPLIAESDPLSLHLDQTVAQTFTGGAVTGTGLLKVTAGTLGIDASAYLTAETDPVFGAWLIATPPLYAESDPDFHALDALNGLIKCNGAGTYSAVTDNSTNWDTAYGWGDHAGLYTPLAHQTTEDAINGLVKVDGAGNYSAITDNSGNWNTAYGWGDHAGLYSLIGHDHDLVYAAIAHNHDSDYISIVGTPTAGNFATLTAGGELENSVYSASSFLAAGGWYDAVQNTIGLSGFDNDSGFITAGDIPAETDPLSLHLDQTTPETFTAGTVTGSGLLKVTAGTLGLDTSTYLTSVTAHATEHEVGGGDLVNHDSLTGFVADEHIDWTDASDQFATTNYVDARGGYGFRLMNGVTRGLQLYSDYSSFVAMYVEGGASGLPFKICVGAGAATEALKISTAGALQLAEYGAGALKSDVDGNITAGVLTTALGGTNKGTAWTANGVVYASGTTTLANSANLTYNGTTLSVTSSGAYTGLILGTNDTVRGLLYIYGHAAGATTGGLIYLYNSADYDTTIEYFNIQSELGVLWIGPNTNSNMLTLSGTALALEGNLSLTGDLVVDGGDVGITADTDLLGLASGALSVRGNLVVADSGYVGCVSDTDLMQLVADNLYVNGSIKPAGDLTFTYAVNRTISIAATPSAAGTPLTVSAGNAGGSNQNGGTLTLTSGVSTGTGASDIGIYAYNGSTAKTVLEYVGSSYSLKLLQSGADPKFGIFDAAPVVQQAAITDPSIDTEENNTAIIAILDALRIYGWIKT